MNSTRPQCPLVPGTTFRHVHDWNTIPDITPLMYSTQTDIHSRSSIKANDGTAHHQGERSTGRSRPQGLRNDSFESHAMLRLKSLRKDDHDRTDTCIVHAPGFCLSAATI
jgi:hypothetical protein